MPQYLAIDYLTDVICRKQATLSRMLIAWPPYLSKSSISFDNFNYRQPWLKGSYKLDEKEMILDLKNDLSSLLNNSHVIEQQCLRFKNTEYHLSSSKIEEIIPSSNSDTESEINIPKSLLYEVESNFSYLDFTDDSIISLLEIKHSDIVYENKSLFVNDEFCFCKSFEPFLSTERLQKHMPLLSSLLAKLNVFSIPDPIEAVELTMKTVLQTDLISIDFKVDNSVEYKIEDLTASVYDLHNYEIPEEILYINNFCCSTVLHNPISALEFSREALIADGDLDKNNKSVWDNCCNDIAKLFGVNNTDNFVKSAWMFSMEKMDHSRKSTYDFSELLPNENVTTIDDLLLSCPLVLDASNFLETNIDSVVDALEIKEFELKSHCFERLQSDMLLLKYTLDLERKPSFKTSSLYSYEVPEPLLDYIPLCKDDSTSLHAISSILSIVPEPCQKNLELLLSWDPVLHAANEMCYVRHMTQHESLGQNLNEIMDHENYMEHFEINLNSSSDDLLLINEQVKTNSSSILNDIPSINNDSNSCLNSRSTETTSKQSEKSCASEYPKEYKSDGTPSESKKISTNPCFDPLTNFMVLMGKHDANVLPWKTGAEGKINASNTTSINQGGIKCLSVKRVRSSIDVKTDKSASLSTSENRFPNKKLKKNFAAAQSTPSVLLCSEVVKRKKWSKKVDVCITGLSLDLSCVLEKEAAPLLESLRSRDILPKDATLPSTNREMTRYLIKQQQKLLATLDNDENRRILLDIEMLHRIVSAFYLIVQVSLTSALALLRTSLQQLQEQEKHRIDFHLQQHITLLKQCIDKLKEHILVAQQSDSSNMSLTHPKMSEVHRRLLKWCFKRKSVEDENGSNVVIVCSTVCRYLFMNLCKELSGKDESYPDVQLRPTSVVIDVDNLSSDDILQAFQTSNVLILGEQTIFESFPWNVVGLVVEYEIEKDSPWKKFCADRNIKHLAMDSVLPTVQVDLEESVPNEKFFNYPTASLTTNSLVLIGSEKFSSLGSLLHLLETRYEILIVERCYKHFLKEKSVHHPDLIFDEKTCLLMEDVTNLQDRGGSQVKTLLSVLTMLRKMFSTCYVVIMPIHQEDKEDAPYPLGGDSPLNIARLRASVRQLNNCSEHFQIHILCCFSLEDLAECVDMIASRVISTNEDDSRKNRSWINAEASREEKFLLHFPCISSYVAQRYLSVSSLRELCGFNQDQFQSTSDALEIPRRIAQDLYYCLHHELDTTLLPIVSKQTAKQQFPGVRIDYVNHPPNLTLNQISSEIVNNHPVPYQADHQHIVNHVDPNECRTGSNETVFRNFFPADAGYHPRNKAPFSYANRYDTEDCDRNNQVKMNCFSQLPQLESSFDFTAQNMQVGDEHRCETDVAKLMLNAKQKLNEFVRLNPDRVKRDVSNNLHAFGYEDFNSESHDKLLPRHPFNLLDPYHAHSKSQDNFFPKYFENQRSVDRISRLPSNHFMRNATNIHQHQHPNTSFDDSTFAQRNFEQIPSLYNTSNRNNNEPRHNSSSFEFHRQFNSLHSEKTDYVDDRERSFLVGASGSTNVGIAQPFLQQPWLTGSPAVSTLNHLPHGLTKGRSVTMTPNLKKKLLTYEKVPGSKNGQTRLAFY